MQFGVNHVKSTDKLTSPNEIFTPSTPTTNPVNPALNNHLFNSQFYVNSPKPVTNQFRYEVRNDGYKSPQPKKYIRK